MNVVSVVMAVDHPLIRRGLSALLKGDPGFNVVGETGNGLEAMRLVEQLKPRVLLTSEFLTALNGFEVCRQIKQRRFSTHVAILTGQPSPANALRALHCGAAGFVLDNSAPTELLRALRDVGGGVLYLCPPLSESTLEMYAQRTRALPPNLYDSLTSREREVLQLVAEGRTSVETARMLFISPRTVEVHRANMMRKLKLRTQSDLIRFAIRCGILPPETQNGKPSPTQKKK